MPTYEYECTKCGYNFEVFQAMSDEPLKTCTKCGKKVRRLILGGAGVIFKGSGFYVTDKGKGSPSGGKGGKASGTESKAAETSGTAQSAASSGGSASPAAGDAKKTVAGDSKAAKPAAQTA
jgi:putative FmdB family regulatory protein